MSLKYASGTRVYEPQIVIQESMSLKYEPERVKVDSLTKVALPTFFFITLKPRVE